MQKYDADKPYYREHPLLDTAKACIERQESTCLYLGGGKPHFSVPAVRDGSFIWVVDHWVPYER